jgi:hypothetical protein
MNKTQLKFFIVFSIFAVIGFGPVSPGCLVGMYIVIMRPIWFLQLVYDLYNNPEDLGFIVANESKKIRIKTFLCLLTLFIIDIAPVPVTPFIAFVIILSRPQWFLQVIKGVYSDII